MAYTQEGIMAQIWIAFGQGAGAIRVSQEAALELQRWYYDAITPEIINERWQTDAVQALDRIRAIGRLAALKAAGAGSTVIKPRDVYDSASTVQKMSLTPLCPPEPPVCSTPEWPCVEALSAGSARSAVSHH
jgi:histone H3/H4